MDKNQQIKQLKIDYKTKVLQIKKQRKESLNNHELLDFEKDDIKRSLSLELLSAKKRFRTDILKTKNPEKYEKNIIQLENENKIQDLQSQYFEGLEKIEKDIRKSKRKIKKDKSLKDEYKEKINQLKDNLNNYKIQNKEQLKVNIKNVESDGSVNKYRKIKNTSTIVSKRLNKKVMPILGEISNQKHLVSIRNGFSSLIPLIMIASFITIIRSLPCSTDPNSAHAYLSSYFPKALDNGLVMISSLTMGLMAIGIAFAIGLNLAQQYGESPIMGGLMGFIGFILWVSVEQEYAYLPMAALGAQGLFVSLVTSILMLEMYRIFKKYRITFRLPKSVPPAVSNSFIAIIPAVVYAMIVLVIRYVAGFDLIEEMKNILKPIGSLISDNFGAVILIVLLNSFFWWLGIHGSAITGIITYPFWYPAIAANQAWFNGGMVGPCPSTFPEPYYQWMIWIGGAGSVIGLSIASIIFAKSKQNKAMSKAIFVPSLFNISEPMMFGFPIVLNVYLFIPFMLAPVATAITSTLLIKVFAIHWVVLAPWSLPAPIGAFLASGNNWAAILVSMISVVVATLIYIPFFKMWDKTILEEERKAISAEAEAAGMSIRDYIISQRKLEKVKVKN